jgi:hypothetical protein
MSWLGGSKSARNQKPEVRKISTEQPMIIHSAKDLIVYKVAYESAMAIFEVSKTWPLEERYSLTDSNSEIIKVRMQQHQRSLGKEKI